MEFQYSVLLFSGMLLLAIAAQPLAGKLRLPFTAVLLVVGFLFAEIITGMGHDTGIRWHNFYDLIFYIFLPVLIFEAALNLDARLLLKNLLPILVLAIPLMVLSAGIIAVCLYYGIGHPQGFPWIAALLVGALLSATDPGAVLALFKQVNAPKRLSLLVDGESLFNDATAIVMTGLLLGIATTAEAQNGVGQFVVEFLRVFIGGLLSGAWFGMMSYGLLHWIRQPVPVAVITVIMVYAGFVVSEWLFHVSGVMCVLVTGLFVGYVYREVPAGQDDRNYPVFLHKLWEYKAWIANAMLFLIAGITIQLSMFTDQWLAILIGIGGALLSRALGIFAVMPAYNLLPGVEPISRKYRVVMFLGGIRGAITMALALSLPLELPYWWTVQSIAYGVVIFTIFVQAPGMALLMRKIDL